MIPHTITTTCSSFINEAQITPLFKILPSVGEGFRKIKIRKKSKYEHAFEQYFDNAFGKYYKDLRLRSVVAHTKIPYNNSPHHEPFYIFPVNGYKVLYNKNIEDYSNYLTTLESKIHKTNSVEELLSKVFEYSYTEGTVNDAAKTGSDVLIYNIPVYYAIRASLINDYKKFISS